jgi:hypothetical protein
MFSKKAIEKSLFFLFLLMFITTAIADSVFPANSSIFRFKDTTSGSQACFGVDTVTLDVQRCYLLSTKEKQ